jgi:Flp pilus assembly protein TadG
MAPKSFNWVSAVAVSAVLLFSGCAGNAHIEKDKSADFSKYRTYAWVDKPDEKENKKNRRKELAETNIRNAVNEQLQKSGWKEVSSNPDVLVNYELLVERNQKQQQNAVYSDPFTRSYYNRYSGRMITYYYPSRFVGYDNYSTTVKEGTITITMIDNNTDKTVWQGWTTSELNSSRITSSEIDRNVRTIFKKFDTGK